MTFAVGLDWDRKKWASARFGLMRIFVSPWAFFLKKTVETSVPDGSGSLVYKYRPGFGLLLRQTERQTDRETAGSNTHIMKRCSGNCAALCSRDAPSLPRILTPTINFKGSRAPSYRCPCYDTADLFRHLFPNSDTHLIIHLHEIGLFLLHESLYVEFVQALMACLDVDELMSTLLTFSTISDDAAPTPSRLRKTPCLTNKNNWFQPSFLTSRQLASPTQRQPQHIDCRFASS